LAINLLNFDFKIRIFSPKAGVRAQALPELRKIIDKLAADKRRLSPADLAGLKLASLRD
jgi:hypothetical protein